MITGATGAVALGALGAAKLMHFIPRAVMVGFVDALAILIFAAQLPHLIRAPWMVWPIVAAGIAIMVLLPRLTHVIPAPLVAIVVLTLVTVLAAVAVPTVGDEGTLPDSLPTLSVPQGPLTLETLGIIAP